MGPQTPSARPIPPPRGRAATPRRPERVLAHTNGRLATPYRPNEDQPVSRGDPEGDREEAPGVERGIPDDPCRDVQDHEERVSDSRDGDDSPNTRPSRPPARRPMAAATHSPARTNGRTSIGLPGMSSACRRPRASQYSPIAASAISHGDGQRLRLAFDSFTRYTPGEAAESARLPPARPRSALCSVLSAIGTHSRDATWAQVPWTDPSATRRTRGFS